jgi:hypothetical protein
MTDLVKPSIKINKLKNKGDIEIIDDKITKCKLEISIFKQKLQNEWSKHMKLRHMSNFYATKKNLNESQEELVNTKPLIVESNQIDKNITLLNRKLQTYEKRKEKLLKKQEK